MLDDLLMVRTNVHQSVYSWDWGTVEHPVEFITCCEMEPIIHKEGIDD